MATFVGYDTPVRCGTGSYTIFMDATPAGRKRREVTPSRGNYISETSFGPVGTNVSLQQSWEPVVYLEPA